LTDDVSKEIQKPIKSPKTHFFHSDSPKTDVESELRLANLPNFPTALL
jgi:hypothetical protein